MPGRRSWPGTLARAMDELDQLVNARIERRSIFQRPRPTALWAVINEGVLRRRAGSEKTMRDQLLHLMDVSERSKTRARAGSARRCTPRDSVAPGISRSGGRHRAISWPLTTCRIRGGSAEQDRSHEGLRILAPRGRRHLSAAENLESLHRPGYGLARRLAAPVSDLPTILGRPESTPPKLVDEFLLIRITRPGTKRQGQSGDGAPRCAA
jgi:hypothetical protein